MCRVGSIPASAGLDAPAALTPEAPAWDCWGERPRVPHPSPRPAARLPPTAGRERRKKGISPALEWSQDKRRVNCPPTRRVNPGPRSSAVAPRF